MWKQRLPERPFTYHFLDEDYNKLYVGEQRSSALFTVAATLAILLACPWIIWFSGVHYGSTHKGNRNTKSFGRKYYKHHNVDSKKFFTDDGSCDLVAVPVPWYAGNRWLQDFAFRIPVQGWVLQRYCCNNIDCIGNGGFIL